MRTIAISGVELTRRIASLPLAAVSTRMPLRSSMLLSAKMLRVSSSTSSAVFPTRSSSDRCNRSYHLLLLRRQIGHDAVQEQRGLIQQPFGRFHAFDDNASRHGVQLRILFGRQLPSRKDDDGNFRQRVVVCAGPPRLRSLTCREACRSSTTQSKRSSLRKSRPSAPVPAVTISISSCSSKAVMLSCSAALSSMTSKRFRRGTA